MMMKLSRAEQAATEILRSDIEAFWSDHGESESDLSLIW